MALNQKILELVVMMVNEVETATQTFQITLREEDPLTEKNSPNKWTQINKTLGQNPQLLDRIIDIEAHFEMKKAVLNSLLPDGSPITHSYYDVVDDITDFCIQNSTQDVPQELIDKLKEEILLARLFLLCSPQGQQELGKTFLNFLEQDPVAMRERYAEQLTSALRIAGFCSTPICFKQSRSTQHTAETTFFQLYSSSSLPPVEYFQENWSSTLSAELYESKSLERRSEIYNSHLEWLKNYFASNSQYFGVRDEFDKNQSFGLVLRQMANCFQFELGLYSALRTE